MVTLISVCIGLSIFLIIWQLYFVFDSVPTVSREWWDKPALGFRLVWPLIIVFDFYGARFYSRERQDLANSRLVEAGLEFTLTARQFIAARIVSSLVLTVSFLLSVWLLDSSYYLAGLIVFPWGYVYPDLWIKRVISTRRRKIDRDLPFYLDVVTLAVESGSNLTGALTQAVQKAPESPLRNEFNRVLRDVRAGKARADALRELSERAKNKSLSSVLSGMIQAERSGASLGPVLRSQANQLRSARFSLAEKKAMEAPVRLLAPLVMFIFPTTFLVLGFLVLSKMLQQNLINWAPIVWAYTWPG